VIKRLYRKRKSISEWLPGGTEELGFAKAIYNKHNGFMRCIASYAEERKFKVSIVNSICSNNNICTKDTYDYAETYGNQYSIS
jgi:F0F1-type ATP synthase delta subunit